MTKNTYFRTGIAVLILGVLTVILWVFLRTPEAVAPIDEQRTVQTFIPTLITDIPVPVSGMVVAQESVTVRAQTAGLVDSIFVTEGTLVLPTQKLAAIDAPILRSSIIASREQGVLQTLQQQAQEESAVTAEEKTVLTYNSVLLKQALNERATGKRVQEAYGQLLVQMEQTAVALSSVLDFLDVHRIFLTPRAHTLYLDILSSLYDNQPEQLSTRIVYRIESYDNLLATVALLQKQSDVDIEAALHLSQLLDAQLLSIQDLLTDIEKNFYDEQQVSTTDARYTQYQAHRATLIATQSALRSAQAALQKQLDAFAENDITAETATNLADVDQASASRQALYAADITRQTGVVTQAQLDVLYAQYGLARAQAPFAGWIQKVYVDKGDFVQPGTPLFELVGSGAQEVRVQVAAADLQNLEVGQPFIVEGKTVGYVDRFTRTLSKGSVQVFIALTDGQFVPGEVVAGVIGMQSTDEHIARVPRAFVTFTTQGPRLLLASGAQLQVTIVADYGDELVVKTKEVIDAPLVRPR